MSELIYKGFWYLPETKERVNGTLTYSESNGIELEIFGELGGDKHNIILGYAKDESLITLVDCFVVSRPLTGITITKIIANKMIVGKHFTKKEDITFKSIAFNCSNLEEWLWNGNINFNKKENENKYILEYSFPEKYETYLDDNHLFSIYTYPKLPPSSSIPYYKAIIEEKSFIEIRCIDNIIESFDKLLQYKHRMDAFLTLSIGSPQKTNEIYGIFEETKVDIYMQSYNNKLAAKPILPPNMFINFHWYKSSFDRIIRCWFERYELLEDVLDLYFSLLIQEKPYVQNKFLFRVQVLEAYHRKTHINDAVIKNNKKYIKDLIAKCSNEEDKNFLKEKLGFAYEPSLKERMLELCDECIIIKEILEDERSSKEFNKSDEIESFIKSIRDTRNYLTHYDKSLSKKTLKGIELYKTSEKLDILIRYYIFIELGFTSDECKNIFENIYNFRYKQLLNNE